MDGSAHAVVGCYQREFDGCFVCRRDRGLTLTPIQGLESETICETCLRLFIRGKIELEGFDDEKAIEIIRKNNPKIVIN